MGLLSTIKMSKKQLSMKSQLKKTKKLPEKMLLLLYRQNNLMRLSKRKKKQNLPKRKASRFRKKRKLQSVVVMIKSQLRKMTISLQ